MTARTSHAVGSDTERIYQTTDARTAQAQLWIPGSDMVHARNGFRPGPGGAPGLVTATGTPDANVHIAPFTYLMNSARVSGPYQLCLDAAFTQDVLAGNPADPTNPRKDLIIAQQSDAAAGDADSLMRIRRVTGTPSGSPVIPTVSGSPDFITLATLTIPAATTTITNAMIANPASIQNAVAVGGVLPIYTVAERNALTAYEGMPIYRMDTNWNEFYDGGAWRVDGVPVVSSAANLSLITNPITGQIAVQSDTMQIKQWSGSAWTGVNTPTCRVRQTSTQNLTTSTITPITFTSHDFANPATFHNTGSNTSKLIIPVAGYYWFAGNITYAANATGIRTTAWQVNGAALNGSGVLQPASSVASNRLPAVGTLQHFAANDQLELIGFQSSGGTLATAVSASEQSTISCYLVQSD